LGVLTLSYFIAVLIGFPIWLTASFGTIVVVVAYIFLDQSRPGLMKTLAIATWVIALIAGGFFALMMIVCYRGTCL
jgi:hypothetical protein